MSVVFVLLWALGFSSLAATPPRATSNVLARFSAAEPARSQGQGLHSCSKGPLSAGDYRLERDVTATHERPCFELRTGARLRLQGHRIEGRIVARRNPSGVEISDGQVVCAWKDKGGDSGCITILGEGPATAPLRLHGLQVSNTAEFSRGIHIDWPLAKPSRRLSIELDAITAYVGPQPLVSRSYAISIMGRGQSVAIANSNLTCSENARACQAIMCYGVAMCKIHDNQITMEMNLTATSGRAMLFDGHTEGGEAWNNTVMVNNNRAIRIRDSEKIRVHHNKFLHITAGQAGLAAIHVGDPDGGKSDVLQSSIDHNRFESTGGDILFGRGVDGLDFSDNVMVCDGVCNAAEVARLLLHQKSRIRFRRNTVSGFAPPQIHLDAGSEAVLCDTDLVASGGIVTTKAGCEYAPDSAPPNR